MRSPRRCTLFPYTTLSRSHGFLVCFDEVVTGVGRTGEWFAGAATACVPDIIATAKGLGAGYAAIGAVLVRERSEEHTSELQSQSNLVCRLPLEKPQPRADR